jgi:uncharacterized protein YgfB (UPF0149 family)
MQLYTVSDAVLRDEDFSFHPLLPGEEEDIATKTGALADWCNGFLAGFAYTAAAEEIPGAGLSGQSSEALRDIAALAEAEAAEDEHDDEAEDNFIELVEYLRVAVINIFLDNCAEEAESAPPSGERGPLH